MYPGEPVHHRRGDKEEQNDLKRNENGRAFVPNLREEAGLLLRLC